MSPAVLHEVGPLREAFPALCTGEWLLTCVNAQVFDQALLLAKGTATLRAGEGPLAAVRSLV